MDFRQLRYFVEIVERGSMKRASETLFVAQPSLSQHVRHLESELGVTLLTRSTKGVIPTEAGTQLLGYAKHILALVEQARESIEAGSHEPHGTVNLGLPNSVSLVLSVPLVERIHHDAPKVQLHIIEGMSGYILDWLYSGKLDLALLYGVQRAPGIQTRRLLTESLYLVGAPGTFNGGEEIDLAEIEGLDLILPARPHGLRELIERAARQNGLNLHITTEIDALTQIKALVRRQLGYAILSHSAVYEELQRRELAAWRIRNPAIERSVYVASRSQAIISNATRATTEAVIRSARELVTSGRWEASLASAIRETDSGDQKHIV